MPDGIFDMHLVLDMRICARYVRSRTRVRDLYHIEFVCQTYRIYQKVNISILRSKNIDKIKLPEKEYISLLRVVWFYSICITFFLRSNKSDALKVSLPLKVAAS